MVEEKLSSNKSKDSLIPKVELHVHLEGTVSPRMVRELGARNGITVPDTIFKNDDVYAWEDFLHFLKVYDTVAEVIVTPEDYRDITYDYLRRCAGEGALYVEVMSSPDHAARNGMSYVDHLEGIAAGITDAGRDFNIEGRIIVTCVRHFGAERALQVARDVTDHPHPLVVGFGMGGDEAAFPAGLFAETFARITDFGLSCTVHAGEWVGADGIRDAIETLAVQRIGHGVRAVEDKTLMAEIRARGIVLEICPGSNIATGVYPSFEQHPLPTLLAAGIDVTLNSDDPPFFDTTIGQEYDKAQSRFGLSIADMRAITKTAIKASFVDDATKQALLDRAGF